MQVQPNGCWLFNGKVDKYGRASIGKGQNVVVHRFVYETLVGPIPRAYELHHSCVTPGCCNPAHLEPVSKGQHGAVHSLLNAKPLDRRDPVALLKQAQTWQRAGRIT